jgi:hypothetical protein
MHFSNVNISRFWTWTLLLQPFKLCNFFNMNIRTICFSLSPIRFYSYILLTSQQSFHVGNMIPDNALKNNSQDVSVQLFCSLTCTSPTLVTCSNIRSQKNDSKLVSQYASAQLFYSLLKKSLTWLTRSKIRCQKNNWKYVSVQLFYCLRNQNLTFLRWPKMIWQTKKSNYVCVQPFCCLRSTRLQLPTWSELTWERKYSKQCLCNYSAHLKANVGV